MKTNKIEKTKMDITDLLNEISPDKLERALFVLDYMVKSSVEEGRLLLQYSKSENATIDMIVAWVREKQKAVAV